MKIDPWGEKSLYMFFCEEKKNSFKEKISCTTDFNKKEKVL